MMTSLSEANERWPPDYVPQEPLSDREKWDLWHHMVMGASEALGIRLAAHTNGPAMGIVNLEGDTASPTLYRNAVTTRQDVVEAFRHRIQRIGEWASDPRDWGPSPWDGY